MWQLGSGVFVHVGVLDMMFAVFSYIFTGQQLERDMGTLKTIHRFAVFTVLTLSLFTGFCYWTGL